MIRTSAQRARRVATWSHVWIPLAIIFTATAAMKIGPQTELVPIPVGDATLHARLYRPAGRGPFPAILINHGSGRTAEELKQLGPYEQQAETLGPVFARHGYLCLFLFRRGVGPSAEAGANAVDLMNAEFVAHGQASRNQLQLQLLEGREQRDAAAALAYLRGRPDVDSNRLALVGHSFGGSLTLLLAEHDSHLRALVLFSTAGSSWDNSPELRARLIASLSRIQAPVFFIHAANDYSINPGTVMDATLAQLGRRHRLKIYPPIGVTPDDGHAFPLTGVKIWEPEVFAFLRETMQK
jgi:dienelactone hydrolase